MSDDKSDFCADQAEKLAGNRALSRICIFILTALTFTLSGCFHPCELFSCSRTTLAIAFIGDDGEIYIDIPEFNADQTARLHTLTVETLPANADPECCWEVMAALDSHRDRVDFPIRYGKDVDGMNATLPAKSIGKGMYQISGYVQFLDNGKQSHSKISGRFRHDGKIIHSEN